MRVENLSRRRQKGILAEKIGKRIFVGVLGFRTFEKDDQYDVFDFVAVGEKLVMPVQAKGFCCYPPSLQEGAVTGFSTKLFNDYERAYLTHGDFFVIFLDDVLGIAYWAPWSKLRGPGSSKLPCGANYEWPALRANWGGMDPQRVWPVNVIIELGGSCPLTEVEVSALFALRDPRSPSGIARLAPGVADAERRTWLESEKIRKFGPPQLDLFGNLLPIPDNVIEFPSQKDESPRGAGSLSGVVAP